MTKPTITQAKRWMSALPRDQFDLLLLLLRWREGAVITELRGVLEKNRQGWLNCIEFGLLPPQHHETAQALADECAAALNPKETSHVD